MLVLLQEAQSCAHYGWTRGHRFSNCRPNCSHFHRSRFIRDYVRVSKVVAYLRYAGPPAPVSHHTAPIGLYGVNCTACVTPLRGFEPTRLLCFLQTTSCFFVFLPPCTFKSQFRGKHLLSIICVLLRSEIMNFNNRSYERKYY